MSRIPVGLVTDEPRVGYRSLSVWEKKLLEAAREDKNIEETFEQDIIVSNADSADGTAFTGAAGERLAFHTGKNPFVLGIIAVDTGAAVVAPYVSADGLELVNLSGGTGMSTVELNHGITARSGAAYTVGSFPGMKSIMMEVECKIDDISDITELCAGWRKAAALTADKDDYTDMAAFSIGLDADGQIEIHTILNNAATVETDTTLTDVADADVVKMKVVVKNDGRCFFYFNDAVPTVTAQFTFDAGDVIIPFLHVNGETGDAGVSISSWKVGLV